MPRSLVLLALVTCSLLAILSSSAFFLVEGGRDEGTARAICAALFLWMLHGIYRCCVRLKGSRIRSGETADEEDQLLLPPLDSKQMMQYFFHPADMDFGTTTAIFLLVAAGIRGNAVLFPFLLLATVILKGWLLISYYRLGKAMADNKLVICMDKEGLAWLGQEEGEKGGERYFIVRQHPWEAVTGVRFLGNFAIFTVKKDTEYFCLLPTVWKKEACLRLIRRFFNGGTGNLPVPRKKGIEEEKREIRRLAERNSLVFRLGKRKEKLSVGCSRFGGSPDVPEGFLWPEHNGLPLSFLLQVNCAETAPLDPDGLLPLQGLLLFFYELSEMNGEARGNEGPIRLFYFNGEPESLHRAPIPEALASGYRLPERPLSFRQRPSLPCPEDYYDKLFPGQEWSDRAVWEALEEEKLLGLSGDDAGSMLGYADVIQNSMLSDQAQEDVLLLQLTSLDSDGVELMFGDCGNIYFYIKKRHLLDRDFRKVWFEMQCY